MKFLFYSYYAYVEIRFENSKNFEFKDQKFNQIQLNLLIKTAEWADSIKNKISFRVDVQFHSACNVFKTN